MAGFIRGARQDHRYERKQARELSALPSSSILTQPVDLQRVNIKVLQGWLSQRVQEILGGVEDEILAGMIGNVLEEERGRLERVKGPASARGWSPKELQHTLGAFLSEEGALGFMEELWILLLDAQSSPDGIPQAWGPAERDKYVQPERAEPSKDMDSKAPIMVLGAGPSMRMRSPERVVGAFIEESKEASRRSGRYFASHPAPREYERRSERTERSEVRRYDDRDRGYDGRDNHRRERSRGRERHRLPSPSRSPVRRRESSADTYGSSSPSPTRTPKQDTAPRSVTPRRERSVTPRRDRSTTPRRVISRSPSVLRSRSRSPKRKHHHHKSKKHHHRRHRRREHGSASPSRSRSPSQQPVEGDMSALEQMLRQKALESIHRTL